MDIQDAYCLCVFVRDVKVIFPIVSQAFSVMKQKKKKKNPHATAFSTVNSAAIMFAERSLLLFLH